MPTNRPGEEASNSNTDIFIAPKENAARLHAGVLAAYRWQYILSGAGERRFQKVLRSMTTDDQLRRIEEAIAPLAAISEPVEKATNRAQPILAS